MGVAADKKYQKELNCVLQTIREYVRDGGWRNYSQVEMAHWKRTHLTMQEIKCGFDPWVGKIPWRRKW